MITLICRQLPKDLYNSVYLVPKLKHNLYLYVISEE